MKTNEEIGAEAAEIARKKVLKEAKAVKLTVRKVLRRISQALDAYEIKTSYDKDRGKWVYSKELVAYGVRLDAANLGVTVLDMKPSEKKNVSHDFKQPLTVIIQKFSDSGEDKKDG